MPAVLNASNEEAVAQFLNNKIHFLDIPKVIEAACEKHKDVVTVKIGELQKIGKIPEGILEFQKLKSVGTDCVKGNPDDVLIQLD